MSDYLGFYQEIYDKMQFKEKLLLVIDGLDEITADRILETIFEMRINNATREESYLFCRTILRGAATREGVERIDSHR